MITTIYNINTGQIVAVRSGDVGDLTMPDGYAAITGRYDATTQYIDQQGQPQDLPPKPVDNNRYKLDWSSRTWQIVQPEITENSVREQRNALLQEIDDVSAVRYASLTTEQQTELQQYRQALLDVPQQAGFPESVTWPEKPTWL